MKKALLTTALIAAMGTSAMAGGVAPATTTAIVPVVQESPSSLAVGSLGGAGSVVVGLVALAAVAAVVSSNGSSSDGTSVGE